MKQLYRVKNIKYTANLSKEAVGMSAQQGNSGDIKTYKRKNDTNTIMIQQYNIKLKYELYK